MDDATGASANNDETQHIDAMLYEQRDRYEERIRRIKEQYEVRLMNQRSIFMERMRIVKEEADELLEENNQSWGELIKEKNEVIDKLKQDLKCSCEYYVEILTKYTDEKFPLPLQSILIENEDGREVVVQESGVYTVQD